MPWKRLPTGWFFPNTILREMIREIAMLGGFLGRKCDGEPGVKTLWLSFARLRDFVRGFEFMRSIDAQ
jgi:hypothetical protein